MKQNNMIQMIEQCQVEWKMLGEVAMFYGGLTGKNKSDFEKGNAKYITYKNIFGNLEIDPDSLEMVTISVNEKQNQVKYGDVLFTGSSEIAKEAGISSAITTLFDEPIYLNSFSFGLRFNDDVDLIPEFTKYLFRSNFVRKQIVKTASGVTRFNISKERFKKIIIPIPPLPIQKEIVKILDKLTELEATLEATLEAELSLREKQYQYYRDHLLSFGDDVEWKSLGDVCDYVDYRGKTPKKVDSGIYLVTAKNIKKGFIDYDVSKEYVSEEEYLDIMRRGLPKLGDVLITTEAPCGNIAQVDNENIALAQRVIKYCTKNPNVLRNDFLKFLLLGQKFQNDLMRISTGGTVKGVKGSLLHQLKIPIPPLETQAKIVEILDKFDRLTNSLSEGLPKEIELRRKQYEYYREKLLNFSK
ncbi:restriction endonuclease subunit S [Bisgaard Taxon 45]